MAWEDYKEYIATEVKALNEKRPKRPFKGFPIYRWNNKTYVGHLNSFLLLKTVV